MKIYQLTLVNSEGSSAGYMYFSSMRSATTEWKARGKEGEIRKLEIQLTCYGVLKFLNLYASHPDNG